MAQTTLNRPDNASRPPNTGDSTELGDRWDDVLRKQQAMNSEVYGVIGSTPGTSTFNQITMTDGGNVVLGTSTGTKLGTTSTQKLGFFGTTPSTQPTSANEATVSTATITSVVTTLATTTAPAGYTTTTQANAIVTAINSLVTQVASITTLVNQLRNDLVTLGVIKGS